MAVIAAGVVIGGIFQACLAPIVGRIRFALPPLVTGLVVMMIGLALVKVGIQYAAGGVPAIGKPEYGGQQNWCVAGTVLVTTLGFKFFTKGFWSVAAILLGLIAGYVPAFFLGMVNFANVGNAAAFALPKPFAFGFEFKFVAPRGDH